MFIVHTLDEIQGLIDAHAQFKATLGEADKEFQAIIALIHEVEGFAKQYNVPGANINPYTNLTGAISNPSGVRFKPWCLNVIKPLRTSCANSKIMKLLDVNSPTSQIKSDPGSNAKWTLLLPSAWACRDLWRINCLVSENTRKPFTNSSLILKNWNVSTNKSKSPLSLRTATLNTPWKLFALDGNNLSPQSIAPSTRLRTRS